MAWEWNASSRIYSDPEAGATLDQDGMRDLLSDLRDKMASRFSETASALYDRGASPAEWERELRPIVDEANTLGYALARGGENAMGVGDWDIVEWRIADDYDALAKFAADAGTGQLSADEIANRAELYADGARGGYSEGLAAAWDVDLPVHPPVHPNCQCAWNLTDNAGTVAAYYLAVEPCPICAGYADEYNPYVT